MSIGRKENSQPSRLVYALVPAQPLPVVDLSKSFRDRLLPGRVHTFIRRKYYKYYREVLICAVISYCLNVFVPLVDVRLGRIIATLAALLWIPIGLGSITTLRYDIARLVFRTFDFWFFSAITTTITVTMSMYFGDLRSVRMLIDWIGYHHVVLVDAHVLGLRSLTYFLVVTILSASVVLTWILLRQVDGGSTFTIVTYENMDRSYKLSGIDVIGNGMVSLGFLVAKVVFRRRKDLRVRNKPSAIVQCVIYRCRLKLESVAGPSLSLALASEDSRCHSKENSLRGADVIQHLMFVKFSQTFDATNTLLPCNIVKETSFPTWFLSIVYSVGLGGLILSHLSLFHELEGQEELMCPVCVTGLLCTAAFIGLFTALYQRQLLKLLFTSFDFAFYSFQITCADIGVCILYNWNISRCLTFLSWWLWAQWVFTLDALTPTARRMLKFRVRYAAPVLCLLLIDHLRIMYRIFLVDNTGLRDTVILEWTVWNQHVGIRLIPFYVSRSLTLSLWCSRLIVRLASASSDNVSILRGTVCYDNFFARGRKRSSHISQIVDLKMLASSISRRSRVLPFRRENPM